MTFFELLSLVVSWLAVVIAVVQLRSGTTQQRRQAAFDHIREFASVLQEVRGEDPAALSEEIVDFYGRKRDNLTKPASDYLRFLDTLDRLGLAYKRRAVDQEIVREYFRAFLLSPNTFNRQMFEEIRTRTGVTADYEHLEYLVQDLAHERRNFSEWLGDQIQSLFAVLREDASRFSASSDSAAGTKTCVDNSPEEQITEQGTTIPKRAIGADS